MIALVCKQVQAQSLIQRELLGRPTASSVTLQVFFSDDVEVSVQYGVVSGNYTQQTSWQLIAAVKPAEIVLNGLLADMKYYYQLRYRLPGTIDFITRPEFTFHTQRKPQSSFTFVVQADPHLDNQSDTALYRLCLRNQGEDKPDFMIDLGDYLMTDKLKNSSNIIPYDTIPYRCRLLRSYYETITHSVPLFIANGNHEGEAGWNLNGTANNIAVWGTLERKKYFLNPYPDDFYTGDTTHFPYTDLRGDYYAWQWGNALFVVLDPYWNTPLKPDSLNGWRWTLGKQQYDWLRKTLEQSTASFKFVFAHQLVGGDPDGRGGVEFADKYEWGGENRDGSFGFSANRPGWYKPIKDLLTENRVTIFFHGHDHFFGRQVKDCLVYQETPQPSHPNFQTVVQASDYGYIQGQFLPNSGHLRVTVNTNDIKVEYVRAYLPASENGSRHNKDVSATYFISSVNCYDSLTTGVPVFWNSNYKDELVTVYPNPFKGQTRIELQVSKTERLQIDITDINGRLIKRLLDRQLVQQGSYITDWDGTDFHGGKVPAGVYIYTIRNAGGILKSGRMIVGSMSGD